MQIANIPVRVIGPGSQPAENDGQTLSYIDMPNDMSKYEPPPSPESGDFASFTQAREAMRWLLDALARYNCGDPPLLADLGMLDAANRDLVNQILIEGEVSVTRSAPVAARSQEAVLAGVWRTLYLDQSGEAVQDILEVGDVPHIVRHVGDAQLRDAGGLSQAAALAPAGVVNAQPILVEIEEHCRGFRMSGQTHSINLTLLPMTVEDQVFLDEQLGLPTLDTLSRSYGKCAVRNSGVRDVWWVRYYNSMSTLILNSLEIADVPEVLRAAPEDLRDSYERLRDILAQYWTEL
jgi:hydrogenase-1 operon protein HyaF